MPAPLRGFERREWALVFGVILAVALPLIYELTVGFSDTGAPDSYFGGGYLPENC